MHRTAHTPSVASCADSSCDRPFVFDFWVAADRSGAIRYEQACVWRAVAMVARTSMCCEAASHSPDYSVRRGSLCGMRRREASRDAYGSGFLPYLRSSVGGRCRRSPGRQRRRLVTTFSEVGCYEYLSKIVVSLSNDMLLGTAVVVATVSTSGTDYGLQWTGVSSNR